MSVFAEVLAIEVGLRGVEKIEQGLDKIAKKFKFTEAAIEGVKSGLSRMGVAVGLTIGGIREAIGDEQTIARLESMVGSLKEAESIMESIDHIASAGIWGKDEIAKAAETMEKSLTGSFKNQINLLEKLGAKMGSVEAAADLLAKLNRGQTFGVAMQLGEAGIGPDKLRAAGLDVKGRTINNTPQQITEAIAQILKADTVFERLKNTLGGTLAGFIFEFKELVQTLGEPLLKPLRMVVSIVKETVGWIRAANNATHGWIGMFAIGSLGLTGLAKVAIFMKQIRDLEIQTGAAAAIRTTLQAGSGFLRDMGAAIALFRELRSVESFILIIETARAALLNNWVGIAAAAAIAATAGVIISNNFGGGGGDSSSDEPSTPPSQRPQRRNDTENLYRHLRGKAWTG